MAAAKHRAGLRRLVALQIKEPLKYLEKNIPDLQKMAAAYMPLGTLEELRAQIIDVALDRAFLAEPLPTDAAAFRRRIDEGRARLNLIAQEVARLARRGAGRVRPRRSASSRTAGRPRTWPTTSQAQLQRLVPKRFVLATPWAQLQHLPRYLKAIVAAAGQAARRPGARRRAAGRAAAAGAALAAPRWPSCKGAADARLDEFRWLLEELRVSLFAQELRTPQPVSVKRLDKVWAQLAS